MRKRDCKLSRSLCLWCVDIWVSGNTGRGRQTGSDTTTGIGHRFRVTRKTADQEKKSVCTHSDKTETVHSNRVCLPVVGWLVGWLAMVGVDQEKQQKS